VETDEDLTHALPRRKGALVRRAPRCAPQGVREGRVIPVAASSAHKHVGLAALLNTVREMLPSPAEVGSVIGKSPSGDEIARSPIRATRCRRSCSRPLLILSSGS